MQTKRARKRGTQICPPSEGNLALAYESQGALQGLEEKTRVPRLRLVSNTAEEESEVDAIAQAKGIVAGIGLSLMLCVLWFLIVLVMYRTLKPLAILS